ncbi:MAG: MoaD/ThiS family protein [Actinomycetales bacterium]|nr:MoaD/ThiS family protein [Actinomycetales bacterium]
MAVDVRVPTILRPLTGGEKSVAASGPDIAAVIADLEAQYPGMADRLLDDSGLRRFINIYVNDEDVRFLDGLATTVQDGDAVTILPAVAGG